MTDATARIGLPLMAAAQAQKEVTHNEALALADLAIQAVVQAVAPSTIPAGPVAGQCWIVGASPTGVWTGQAGAIAGWTAGGWRFVAPFEGMQVWSIADGVAVRRAGSAWVTGTVPGQRFAVAGVQVVGAQQAAFVRASGGSVIDVEARAAIDAILARLRAHGLIAT